jgi:formylglycine-generating enzyme required for sulfatase activity
LILFVLFAVAVASAGELETKLEELKRLKDKGLLADDEYQTSRKKLLEEFVRSGGSSGTSVATGVVGDAASTAKPEAAKNWKVPDLGMEFVWIEAMKCWVGKYEVTNAEWRKWKGKHEFEANLFLTVQDTEGKERKFNLGDDRQPVVLLRYDNVVAYGRWLTEKEEKAGRLPSGYEYRLPTGLEWTTLAQCGDDRDVPWGKMEKTGNVTKNSHPPADWNYRGYEWQPYARDSAFWYGHEDKFVASAPVEESGKNDWGLYGVGGNVSEWTCEKMGNEMAVRGGGNYHGGWANVDMDATRQVFGVSRKMWLPVSAGKDVGFRLLLAPTR